MERGPWGKGGRKEGKEGRKKYGRVGQFHQVYKDLKMVKSSKPASEFQGCQSPGESKRTPLLIESESFSTFFSFPGKKLLLY